ncbi:TetR/AcrR family transcriptional regulator [Conexibacter arvalis]|uniref:AcrR family transcriptional regulator n=1 Tax=Conexibacter arvalis TaxID=912552 RepID=A0A840IBL1_9ACTN|nr:TetR/AcrR family transcriptional regulator [Conexibacter arvalis]MBB4662052.1 AcrR family transcriptional regulator [Conexibacter arvalis]
MSTPPAIPEPEAGATAPDATTPDALHDPQADATAPPGPCPAARPLRADAARNRLKVLDAARAAFAQDGRDAQMDDIARRAGVGVGTVYRHFPTKESLAQAMVQQRFEQILAFIRDELLVDPDPWRALERSFEFCGSMQERDRGYAELVASVAGSGPLVGGGPVGPAGDQVEEMLDLTEQLLARAHAAGVVRADLKATDMPPFYAALASIVQAGVVNWRRYVAIVLDGLRARPGERDG